MSYIGAQPTTGSFPFDQFSGNGSTTAFTLTYAPASTTSIIVAISGVVQNPNLYSVIGTTITFSPAPPTGTNNISVLYLGLPVIGVSSPGNTAYFSSTSFTATASQTTFTPSGSYQVGFINVIRNGSQLAPADYTATNGTTVVLNNACTAGDIVVIEVYTLTSISNALPLTGGTVTGASTFNAGVNLAVSSGNVGIGTSSPSAFGGVNLQVQNSSLASILWSNGTITGQLLCSSGAEVTVGSRSNHPLRFGTNDTERARIDTSGNVGINNTSPAQYATSGKVVNITGTANNSGPANLFMPGSSTQTGAGYASTEVFAVSSITSATEITRVTGTNTNGFRAYFKVIVTGHTGGVGNGINIKEYFWDGGTGGATQISTYTNGQVPGITITNSTNYVLIINLSSSNGVNGFNGVMKVEWMLPIDFAASTYTIS